MMNCSQSGPLLEIIGKCFQSVCSTVGREKKNESGLEHLRELFGLSNGGVRVFKDGLNYFRRIM